MILKGYKFAIGTSYLGRGTCKKPDGINNIIFLEIISTSQSLKHWTLEGSDKRWLKIKALKYFVGHVKKLKYSSMGRYWQRCLVELFVMMKMLYSYPANIIPPTTHDWALGMWLLPLRDWILNFFLHFNKLKFKKPHVASGYHIEHL